MVYWESPFCLSDRGIFVMRLYYVKDEDECIHPVSICKLFINVYMKLMYETNVSETVNH